MQRTLLPTTQSPSRPAPPNAPAGGALCVLAFDTATERMAIGLHADGGDWHLVADGGAQASAALLPQIAGLLARAGRSRADISHIGFGRGPGAFTGLRTACAVAQGLGFGLTRPVLALDSLLVVAEDARAQAGTGQPGVDVAVLMDARMDEVYAARYRWDGARWQPLRQPALLGLAALQQGWWDAGDGVPQVLAGSALAAFAGRLALPPASRVLAHEHDRAAALLRLAVAAARAGEGADAALALPLYLRDKVAQTTRERDDARAQRAGGAP